MKLILTTIIILQAILGLNVNAQETQIREPGEFDAVTVIGDIRVELYKAERSFLEITYEGIDAGDIITGVEERALNIRMKTASDEGALITIKLNYTDLRYLEAQAHALITSPEVLQEEKMEFVAKSGAKFELELNVEELGATVNQGAIMVFRGTVDKQEIKVNSGATFSAFDLSSDKTFVKAATGGKAKVRAAGLLEGSAGTKGYIGYKGNPAKINLRTGFGGEVVDMEE